MDLLDLDRRALDVTGAFVRKTAADQLGLPTPCSDWDVRALLDHVVGGNDLYATAAAGTAVDWDERNRRRTGDDVVADYERSAAQVTAAFAAADPATELSFPFGVLPVEHAVAVHFVDVLVHGWDLAVAIGQDPALPDDLSEAALAIVGTYPPDVWGTPAFFAERIEAAPDDPPYVRLVKLVGRAA